MTKIEQRAQDFIPILRELTPILSRIPNEVVYDEKRGYGLKLGGFYKDGSVTIVGGERGEDHLLRPGEAVATVYGRFDVDEIYSTDLLLEILKIQAQRFRYWNEVKPDDFKTIDANWLPLLKDAGLVKEEISYSVI